MNKKIANMIDHTILKATATKDDVVKLCKEAKEYGFFSVCINPANIELAKEELKGSNVKVCTVIGFPLGANTSAVKAFETKDAIAKGADEVDMVINIGALKDKNYELVYEDIKAVVGIFKFAYASRDLALSSSSFPRSSGRSPDGIAGAELWNN